MLIKNIRDLIAQNHLEEAIDAMRELAAGTRQENDVQLLSGRYHSLKQQTIRGAISNAEADQARNKITYSLLELLKDLPDGSTLTVSVTKPPASSTTAGTGDGNPPSKPPSGTGDGTPHSTGTGDGGSPGSSPGNPKLAFWFAVAAIAVLLAITLWVPAWAGENNALFRTLLALAAAGVAATLPGFLHLNWGSVAKAGGAISAFLLVFLFNPANEKSAPVSLRIYVEKKGGGWPELSFPSEASVKIIFPSGPKTARLFDEQAEFPGVPPEDLGEPLRIRLENAEPFSADSTIDLKGKTAANLQAHAVGLGQVSGQVFDGNNNPLAGVVLTLEGQFDTTGRAGLFEFSIPENRQKDRYRLIGKKTGYRDYNEFVNPGRSLIPVVMSNVKK